MKSRLIFRGILGSIVSGLLFSPLSAVADSGEEVNLKGKIEPGPSTSTNATSSSAPSSSSTPSTSRSVDAQDATMNQDMLFVAPKKSTIEKTETYGSLDQNLVDLTVTKSDIDFEKVRGLLITATNNSSKPIVVNGDNATISLQENSLKCVPVEFIQRMIIPPHKLSQDVIDLITKVAPAGASVGAIPTVQDIRRSGKPILERYGADEVRRKIEFTRFGRRIIWSHQQVSGILYFDTKEELANTKLTVPIALLFSPNENGTVTAIAPPPEKTNLRAQAPETSAPPNLKPTPAHPTN
jgi:hypothetical protein